MDEAAPIFKALADEHRRRLLDSLHQRDGQTLGALCAHLPDLSRFGCMKHLKVLEEADLVTTRKIGREKLHYLNPVPIQVIYERWVSKYAQPWATALIGLKVAMEAEQMGQTPAHIQEVFIRTTPEQLWRALIDGEMTRQYYFGSRAASTWQPGAPYSYTNPDGTTLLDGEVVEADPPRRLVTTFNPRWAGDESATPSTVVFEIAPVGAVCKLTLSHFGLAPAGPLTAGITTGWAQILSGLKTLLETGEPLPLGD